MNHFKFLLTWRIYFYIIQKLNDLKFFIDLENVFRMIKKLNHYRIFLSIWRMSFSISKKLNHLECAYRSGEYLFSIIKKMNHFKFSYRKKDILRLIRKVEIVNFQINRKKLSLVDYSDTKTKVCFFYRKCKLLFDMAETK